MELGQSREEARESTEYPGLVDGSIGHDRASMLSHSQSATTVAGRDVTATWETTALTTQYPSTPFLEGDFSDVTEPDWPGGSPSGRDFVDDFSEMVGRANRYFDYGFLEMYQKYEQASKKEETADEYNNKCRKGDGRSIRNAAKENQEG